MAYHINGIELEEVLVSNRRTSDKWNIYQQAAENVPHVEQTGQGPTTFNIKLTFVGAGRYDMFTSIKAEMRDCEKILLTGVTAGTGEYRFDAYDEDTAWSYFPAKMTDGEVGSGNAAITYTLDDVQLLTGNNCPGAALGDVSKVEIRCNGASAMSTGASLNLRPVFGGAADGDNHLWEPTGSYQYSEWFNITDDTNAPSPWTGSDVGNLDCDVHATTGTDGSHGLGVSQVEIRVAFASQAKYLFGNNTRVWLSQSNLNITESSGKRLVVDLTGQIDPYQIHTCDFLTDWTGTSLTSGTAHDGKYAVTDTVATPVATSTYDATYTPYPVHDVSGHSFLTYWVYSDRASTAYTSSQFILQTSAGNYYYWDTTYSADAWTFIECDLSSPDGTVGSPSLSNIGQVVLRVVAADTTAFYHKIDNIRVA